jgi:2'-5' RNA ligase
VTLLFLGEVAGAAVGPLGTAVARAAAASAPMTLRIAGAGSFGSRRRPQVCWAGLAGDVAELTALAGRLAGAGRELGLAVEDRPFRAHLTVGRWRPGRPADPEPVTRLAGYRGPRWPVERVELLRSHLGPEPRYELVAAWPVGQGPPGGRG